MEIKSIKLKNKKNTNIFLVLSNVGEFEFHSEAIVKHNIKTGEVDSGVFNLAKTESEILIATEKAIKYISTKLKTEQQIKDYLYKQGYHKNVVNEVLKKLAEYGVINDKTFAQSYINSNKNFSTNKLKQKLISFGVKQEVLIDLLTNLDDTSSCKTYAQKFLKNKVLNNETKIKLTRHLAGKGYNFETINHVLNELKFDDDYE